MLSVGTNTNYSNANLTNCQFYYQSPSGNSTYTTVLTGDNFHGAIITGANFSYTTDNGFVATQLYSTASYVNHDLAGIELVGNNLSGWNFDGQNLTGANFGTGLGVPNRNSTLVGTNFFNANLTHANFDSSNLTNATLKNANVTFTEFVLANLTNANFTNAYLSYSHFAGTTVTNANFTGTDIRGASGWTPDATTVTNNTIRPDGSIQGLALGVNVKLVVRNNSIPITVTTSATMDPTATLQFLLEGRWTSPMGFSPGLTPILDGTLNLQFAAGIDPTSLFGQSFQLFNWNGPLPAGDQFGTITIEPGFMFDTSDLYTTGAVTLTGVPEPSSSLLVGLAGMAMLRRFVKRKSR
jgi:uncharacterized protein YjbI with pentapeptide repeats